MAPGAAIRSRGRFPGMFAFTRDGGMLAVDLATFVLLVDPESGRELATLEPPPDLPRGFGWQAFTPDGGLLAVPVEQDILVWDLRQIRRATGGDRAGLGNPSDPTGGDFPDSAALRVRIEGADALAEVVAGGADRIAGNWDGAAAAYARAVAKGADDPVIWYRHLLLCLRAGDRAGYRAGCAALIARFGRDLRPGFVEPVAWACAVGPDALADWSATVRSVEAAVKQRPGNAELRKTLSAVLVRAGRSREAVTALEESVRRNGQGGNAFDWLFLAMAHNRLGQAKDAGEALAKARDWIAHGDERAFLDPYVNSPLPWFTRLELELLLREAEGLISPASGDLPAQVFAPG